MIWPLRGRRLFPLLVSSLEGFERATKRESPSFRLEEACYFPRSGSCRNVVFCALFLVSLPSFINLDFFSVFFFNLSAVVVRQGPAIFSDCLTIPDSALKLVMQRRSSATTARSVSRLVGHAQR